MFINPPVDTLHDLTETDHPRLEYTIEYVYLGLRRGEFADSTLSVFYEQISSNTLTFDLPNGKLNSLSIFDIGIFEITNYHQWENREPIRLLSKREERRPLFTEPTMWDVSTVDNSSGKRILAIRTHSSKDDVFTICNRLNAILEYTRLICEPWRDLIIEDKAIPHEELKDAISHNPPRFKFEPLRPLNLNYEQAEIKNNYIKPAFTGKTDNSTADPKIVFFILAGIALLIWLVLSSS